MEEHRSDARETKSHLFTAMMGFMFVIPVLYVLSIGPVARVIRSAQPVRAPHWVDVVYFPLIWLHENTPLEKPLDWYVEVWTEGPGP